MYYFFSVAMLPDSIFDCLHMTLKPLVDTAGAVTSSFMIPNMNPLSPDIPVGDADNHSTTSSRE